MKKRYGARKISRNKSIPQKSQLVVYASGLRSEYVKKKIEKRRKRKRKRKCYWPVNYMQMNIKIGLSFKSLEQFLDYNFWIANNVLKKYEYRK